MPGNYSRKFQTTLKKFWPTLVALVLVVFAIWIYAQASSDLKAKELAATEQEQLIQTHTASLARNEKAINEALDSYSSLQSEISKTRYMISLVGPDSLTGISGGVTYGQNLEWQIGPRTDEINKDLDYAQNNYKKTKERLEKSRIDLETAYVASKSANSSLETTQLVSMLMIAAALVLVIANLLWFLLRKKKSSVTNTSISQEKTVFSPKSKKCVACAEKIKVEANICKHCGTAQ